MAGEPILIVDDTPVNLKLTRILLVNEGYQVLTAASAEEALELVASHRPRLVLADIQLPGIDGLEMTRRIKQDARTRDTLVVALTAFAMKGDEQKALDAGCDGYITKPIDTRSLGRQIRALLERKGAALPPESSPTADPEIVPAAEMHALRRRFLEEGQDLARRLLAELDGPFDAAAAARAVHTWIGTGGLLGFTVIARLAREVETLLRERPVDVAQVRESLTNLVLAFTTPPEARDIPLPGAITESLAQKRIALVGLPAHETQRLCVALELAGARAQFFELSSSPGAEQLDGCDLLVIYVHPQSAGSPWLDPAFAPGRPVLFVGSREDLPALDPAVQAMAAEYLMDSWQPDEALVRLCLALTHKAPAPPPAPGGELRVLVSAAQESVPELARLALQDAGMEVHDAPHGPETVELARRLKPQAAILDVDTSAVNASAVDASTGDGYQVLSALRAEHTGMRIVLLTAPQQENGILRGFTLGADDYVVKPFSPMELVARLRRLIGK
jgi:CheY-like chemotaxis protein